MNIKKTKKSIYIYRSIGICLATAALVAPIVTSITSCSCFHERDGELDKIGKEYASKYFTDWYNNLTVNPNTEWYKHIDGAVDYEADAVMLLSYYGGWDVWNEKLHQNKGEIPQELWNQKGKSVISPPSLKNIYDLSIHEDYECNLNYGSYKTLERALRKGKCGPITTYHGFEKQETELLAQISGLLDVDQSPDFWKDKNSKETFRNTDLSKLKDQVLDYDGYCCTSLNKEVSFDFLDNSFSGEYNNVVMYDIDIDENTHGGYVSTDLHLFYDRTLAWYYEYQIALANKLKFRVKDAYWTNSHAGKNVLYLKVQGYHLD